MRVAADSEESFDCVDRTYDFICLLQSTQLLTSWPFKQLIMIKLNFWNSNDCAVEILTDLVDVSILPCVKYVTCKINIYKIETVLKDRIWLNHLNLDWISDDKSVWQTRLRMSARRYDWRISMTIRHALFDDNSWAQFETIQRSSMCHVGFNLREKCSHYVQNVQIF